MGIIGKDKEIKAAKEKDKEKEKSGLDPAEPAPPTSPSWRLRLTLPKIFLLERGCCCLKLEVCVLVQGYLNIVLSLMTATISVLALYDPSLSPNLNLHLDADAVRWRIYLADGSTLQPRQLSIDDRWFLYTQLFACFVIIVISILLLIGAHNPNRNPFLMPYILTMVLATIIGSVRSLFLTGLMVCKALAHGLPQERKGLFFGAVIMEVIFLFCMALEVYFVMAVLSLWQKRVRAGRPMLTFTPVFSPAYNLPSSAVELPV